MGVACMYSNDSGIHLQGKPSTLRTMGNISNASKIRPRLFHKTIQTVLQSHDLFFFAITGQPAAERVDNQRVQ